jgi:hypothetical protein
MLKQNKTYLFKNRGAKSVFYAGIASISEIPDQAGLTELQGGDEIQLTSTELGYPQNILIYFCNKDTIDDAGIEIGEL